MEPTGLHSRFEGTKGADSWLGNQGDRAGLAGDLFMGEAGVKLALRGRCRPAGAGHTKRRWYAQIWKGHAHAPRADAHACCVAVCAYAQPGAPAPQNRILFRGISGGSGL
jgi:hypothetical protein